MAGCEQRKGEKVHTAAHPSLKTCATKDTDSPTPHSCKGDASATGLWMEDGQSLEKIQLIRKLMANLEKQLASSSSPPPPSTSPNTVHLLSFAPSSLFKLKKPLFCLPTAHLASPQKRATSPGEKRKPPAKTVQCHIALQEYVSRKKRKTKLPYNAENICHVTNKSVKKAKTSGRRVSNLKSMKKCSNTDLEDLTNFPQAKTVVHIRSGSRQAWDMIKEAKKSFTESSPIIIMNNDELKKTETIYRALKITFLGCQQYIPRQHHQDWDGLQFYGRGHQHPPPDYVSGQGSTLR